MLAPEFGSTRPKDDPNSRYQKSYGTQAFYGFERATKAEQQGRGNKNAWVPAFARMSGGGGGLTY